MSFRGFYKSGVCIAASAAIGISALCGCGVTTDPGATPLLAKASRSAPNFTVEQQRAIRSAIRLSKRNVIGFDAAESRMINLAAAAAVGPGPSPANFQGNTTAMN